MLLGCQLNPGIYKIQSLRELDAIISISFHGWDKRLLDIARSDNHSLLDGQIDERGETISRLPRFSCPKDSLDIRGLWSLQSALSLALIPVANGVAWASISTDWILAPTPGIKGSPYQLTPKDNGTWVGKNQEIAICLGALARKNIVFDVNDPVTRQILLPKEMQ